MSDSVRLLTVDEALVRIMEDVDEEKSVFLEYRNEFKAYRMATNQIGSLAKRRRCQAEGCRNSHKLMSVVKFHFTT